ncbi:MAG TPA: HEAT repeat domain-containing protein [Tepidisphaeraceae bacterium]|nr:HEAT repeat domain-containing protein [Tepidisphaeraceae bacterium]
MRRHGGAAAYTAAARKDEKLPKFPFAQSHIASETEAAIQAAGARIDPFLDPLIKAIPPSTRDGGDAYADAMRNAGPGLVRATSTLLDLLRKHGVWSLRSGIRVALVQAAKFDPSLLTTLRGMLLDDDSKIRGGAADILGAIGDAAKPAADELLELSSRSVEDRIAAMYAKQILSWAQAAV